MLSAQIMPALKLNASEENLNIPAKYTFDARSLSNALTKDKPGEKEKFEAIFTG